MLAYPWSECWPWLGDFWRFFAFVCGWYMCFFESGHFWIPKLGSDYWPRFGVNVVRLLAPEHILSLLFFFCFVCLRATECFSVFSSKLTMQLILRTTALRAGNLVKTSVVCQNASCANYSCQNVCFCLHFHLGRKWLRQFYGQFFERCALLIGKSPKSKHNKIPKQKTTTGGYFEVLAKHKKMPILWFKTKQRFFWVLAEQHKQCGHHWNANNKQSKSKKQEPGISEMRNRDWMNSKPRSTRIAGKTAAFIRSRKKLRHKQTEGHLTTKQNKPKKNKTRTTPRPLQQKQRTNGSGSKPRKHNKSFLAWKTTETLQHGSKKQTKTKNKTEKRPRTINAIQHSKRWSKQNKRNKNKT